MSEQENCNHNCESCSANCSSRTAGQQDKTSFLEEPNPMSSVKKVIGVVLSLIHILPDEFFLAYISKLT